MTTIWEPDRVARVGEIMSRYSEYLAPGDIIRLQIEGDPCNPYRAAQEAPRARVLDEGFVRDGASLRFRAQPLDGDDVVAMSNSDLSRVWEVDPDYLPTFQQRLATTSEPDFGAAAPDATLTDLRQRQTRLEQDLRMAMREIAADVLRTYRGAAPEFSPRYVDRYDQALLEEPPSSSPPDPLDRFQGLKFPEGTLSEATLSDS